MTSSGADFLGLHRREVAARGLTAWLVDEVRGAVADGRLAPGARLPASRVLARELGVSRGVVVEAYRRLAEEALVVARTGDGTVVAAATPPPRPRPAPPHGSAPGRAVAADGLPLLPEAPAAVAIDLSPGLPDLSAFPRGAWLRAERAVLAATTGADLGYGDPRGSPRLRAELAAWLRRTRGMRADPEDMLIVSGVAQALALLAQVLRDRGESTVAIEDPGSRGSRLALAHWGVEGVPVRVDEHGLVVDELARTGVGSAVLTPAHQFPTGVVLAPDRRRALLRWAAQVGGLVVEDDYDAEHRYDRAPVPALHASAPDLVVHTGSTSKTLAPGMRLGWMIPPPHLYPDLVAAKWASDLGNPILPQLVLAHLLASGAYDRHLRVVRGRQRVRRDAMLAAVRDGMPGARVDGVAAGLHLSITLDEGPGAVDDLAVADRARRDGILVHPLTWHRQRPGPPGLVAGYAAHPPDRLRDAVARLAAAVREG